MYPASVPTLFNQLDAAHVSWKGYAQDLGNPDASGSTHDAGTQYLRRSLRDARSDGKHGPAESRKRQRTDQYVPKHFPFPWFESILQSGDCNAQHIANLFDSTNGLYHDLQSEATTPAFSWISPNNCSDGHDAVCHGNNLSGGFSSPTTANEPVNFTGGLYAADLFLEHVIPEIEESPAFKDGGLIDVTFDEGFPPFTYTGNSFANSTIVPPDAATSVASDSAAETLFGFGLPYEPTGPNTPLAKDSHGNELYPGTGRQRLHRPAEQLRRSDGAGAAGGDVPARGRRTLPGRAHRRGGDGTGGKLIDRRQRSRRHRRRTFRDRRGHSGGRVRRQGDRHARDGDCSQPERRLRGHGVVHVGEVHRRTTCRPRARSAV